MMALPLVFGPLLAQGSDDRNNWDGEYTFPDPNIQVWGGVTGTEESPELLPQAPQAPLIMPRKVPQTPPFAPPLGDEDIGYEPFPSADMEVWGSVRWTPAGEPINDPDLTPYPSKYNPLTAAARWSVMSAFQALHLNHNARTQLSATRVLGTVCAFAALVLAARITLPLLRFAGSRTALPLVRMAGGNLAMGLNTALCSSARLLAGGPLASLASGARALLMAII